MGYTFWVDIRTALTVVNKVALVFSIVQFVSGIILIGIAGSLAGIVSEAKDAFSSEDPFSNDPTTSSSGSFSSGSFSSGDVINMWGFVFGFRKFALSFAVPLLIVGLIGILAYITASKAGIIIHTVFSSLLVPYGMISLIVPALENFGFSLFCQLLDGEPLGQIQHFEDLVCGSIQNRLNAITCFVAINIFASLMAAILGCLGTARMGLNSGLLMPLRSGYDGGATAGGPNGAYAGPNGASAGGMGGAYAGSGTGGGMKFGVGPNGGLGFGFGGGQPAGAFAGNGYARPGY